MKLIVPDSCPEFRCIAGACRHTCCAGWEIGIDEDTAAYYRTIPGPLGERLRCHMAEDDEGAHFLLDEKERCPFLNRDGLCDLILDLGEDSLCQICADHPRFRNYLSDRTEMGLGLCCEAAAQLLLNRASPMALITLEDDGGEEALTPEEEAVLSLRDELLRRLQDRSRSMAERLTGIEDRFGVRLPRRSPAAWAEIFLGLEQLDRAWTALLQRLRDASLPEEKPSKEDLPEEDLPDCLTIPLEQFACYAVFRHILPAAEDGDAAGRIAFVLLSVHLLRLLSLFTGADASAFADLARMYSAEIEYSDENMEKLIGACRE